MLNDTARRIKPYLAAEWRPLAGSAVMTVLVTVGELLRPFPVKILVDHLFVGRPGGFTMTSADWRITLLVAALVIATAAIMAIGLYFSALWMHNAGERIAHSLRVALYDHLQSLSLRFHLGRQKGDLVTRVTADVNSIGDLFTNSIGSLAQEGLQLFGMFVVAFFLDPLLAVVCALILPGLALLAFGYRRELRVSSKRQRAHEGVIASRATEALSAMSVVKAFGSEAMESERVSGPSESRMAVGFVLGRLQARFEGWSNVLTAGGTAAVVVVGVWRVAGGHLTAGDLAVFIAYARGTTAPMKAIAREWTKVAKNMARADQIAELLAIDDVLEERPDAYSGPRAAGGVELHNVTFAYRPDRPAVLQDVSLSIRPGERVALVGPSGAGKSTIGALIARFHDPTSGGIALDGRDVRDCDLAWLRSQVGVLLQDTVLFSGTVDENIGYATLAGPEEITAAAVSASADGFIETLADGYQTDLGPQGVGLSGGQRQRIGIARTLLRDPAVLVLDEPTSALDAESEAQVLEGLEGLMRGRTTVMITHSFALARRADRVLVVDDGHIVAEGTPEELLGERGAYRRVLDQRRKRTTRRGPRVPADRGLPQLRRLLDVEDMAGVLQQGAGPDHTVEHVEVEQVKYKPGDRAYVHYGVDVDGHRHDAVALADAHRDLEQRLDSPAYQAAADLVRDRTPTREPVAFDAGLGALISWLPFDISIPGLMEPPERIVERLEWSGLTVGEGADHPRLLSYRPKDRAVLRLDGHVVKAYADPHAFEHAVAGLRGGTGVPSPNFELALWDLRLTVQSAVDATAPEGPAGVAAGAGDLLRRLHGEDGAKTLPVMSPERLLALTEEKAALAATLLPPLRQRINALLGRLADRMPPADRFVTSHGDFRVGQLLVRDGELMVIDFDDMCLAAPALDVATYACDAVTGPGMEDVAPAAVLEQLLEGYGERPAALDWYLATVTLEHVARPFRQLSPKWPQRVEQMVLAAEEALN